MPEEGDSGGDIRNKLFLISQARLTHLMQQPTVFDIDWRAAVRWFLVLCNMVKQNHSAWLPYIQLLISIPSVSQMVINMASSIAESYRLLDIAKMKDSQVLFNALFQSPQLFGYALEQVGGKYERYIHFFMVEKMKKYHRLPDVLSSFEEEKRLSILILKRLIRRNSDVSNQEARFLLRQPSLEALAHQDDNALLQMALEYGNVELSGLLLTFPLVFDNAEVNDFYPLKSQGLLVNYYHPILYRAYGEQHYTRPFKHLFDTISKKYSKDPIYIHTGEGTLSLPLTWEEFERFFDKPATRNGALQAYYKHPIHTAYRYLSTGFYSGQIKHDNFQMASSSNDQGMSFKNDDMVLSRPNPWQDNAYSTQSFSAFALAFFYIAILDIDHKKHTHDALNTFIKALAEIARLHNKYAVNTHEHDDLQADKPGCLIAAKDRFFTMIEPALKSIVLQTREKEWSTQPSI